MNSLPPDDAIVWCSVKLEAVTQPHHRLAMCMLAHPNGEPLWGMPAQLAASANWDLFIAETDEMVKPYLHWVSQQSPFREILPAFVVEHLSTARHSTRIRNLQWAAELRAIVEKFSTAQVPLIVAKGSVLQRTVYPDISTRPMSDIDIYVKGEHMEQAYRLLPELQILPVAPRDSQTPLVNNGVNEEGKFLKHTHVGSLLIEVHTQLEMNFDRQIPSWETTIDVAGVDRMILPTLDTNTALRHICFHLARHDFEHGLMWLLDIKLFIETWKDSINWTRLLEGCDPDARPLLGCTLATADDWLGAAIPKSIRSLVSNSTMRSAQTLIWKQMWELERTPPVLPVVAVLLSGNPLKVWRYLVDRYRSWTAPLPQSIRPAPARMARRLSTAASLLISHARNGSFSTASIRAAIQSDRRAGQIKHLLWKQKIH